MRIGFGYDIHRATRDKTSLILCGVRFDCGFGLIAHSDGDVPVHAICDALLGAAALGDIGKHFPDTDESLSGMDSLKMLADCVAMVRAAGYDIGNIDCVIIAEAPKIAAYRDAMRDNIAYACGIAPSCVNVKATTNEKTGSLGRGEAIASHAVALLAAKN